MGLPLRVEARETDTIRDVEAPSDVRALMDAIAAGESVERTALIEHLDRMLRLVVRTDADFDDLVLLVRGCAPAAIPEDADVRGVHGLPDGTLVVHTTWSMSTRNIVAASFDDENAELVSAHDDERGVPCFRAAQLEVALSASTYEDALYLLGDAVTFLVSPSLIATTGD